ncbi:type IX secretion system sortase PorU [Rhodocytophaga aerolata]|uniref:Type IX secretion system sortase PorU n=1 Tax=Rhodocytophaga aerolata TaxID=455078 RepID=A0ABT8QZC5_9BACT|nr:type IX secretion system sortase PorU [Rhodocytophaga aerolata]MDO1445201.1 type IX secretion system sortase PorU [Rhodocytophaga aerolata]
MPFFRLWLLFLLLILGLYHPSSAQPSVLAASDWYKIGITKKGIYKLDRAFLQKAGINVSSLLPQQIKLYGNGGGMLPQANSSFRHSDLVENAIYVEGEKDGQFNEADYILFYAQSPHSVSYNEAEKKFLHQTNLYSDTTFYFLTVGPSPGLRIQDQPSESGAGIPIATFDEYVFHEKEERNQLASIDPAYTGSGREWYGERFVDAARTQTLEFELPGLVANSTVHITSAVMARANGTTTFNLKANEVTVGTQSVPGVSSDRYDLKGINQISSFTLPATWQGDKVTLNYVYDLKGATRAEGYLNYVGIQVKRHLKVYTNQTSFRTLESLDHPMVTYQVQEASPALRIWDITDPLQAKNQLFSLTTNQATFTASTGKLKEYIAFTGSTFDAPLTVQKIPNQDLHSLAVPQFLIITPPQFLQQAHQLAAFRESHDGLSVAVTTPALIYNEFSSGRQDITAIRDFIRYLYKKNNALQYVLLLGDASYDYKNRITGNTNFVPIYESRESLHPIFSYSSDDYYGFMDETEGEWTENMQGDHTMDVAIGRLPIKSVAEAQAVVQKLIRYASDANTTGKWRNKIAFVADDGDNNTHQLDAERLASQVSRTYPMYNLSKIYLDAFPQNSSPNGQTAPEVKKSIDQAIQQGHLIVNYTGHGGEIGWTEEQILTVPQINSWKNAYMPLLVTATCEFGRYDDPLRVSGAEYAVLHPQGGAIGLLTTTRPVFSNTNYALNTAFYSSVFEQKDGQRPRLGDIIKYTKNNSLSGSVNRNFALLGDPSMRLAYPQEEAAITRINGKDLSQGVDTLKALSHVHIEGQIQIPGTSTLQADFNGLVYITVYDKASTLSTLGTERSNQMNFQVQQNTLYEGKATVKNGVFQFSFVVPKDIDYRFDTGKISLYAQQEASLRDASGAQLVVIGGSAQEVAADNIPPQIRLFMNDTTFVSGGITGSTTSLLAYFSDESGINITRTGIGHGIRVTLSSGRDTTLLLNEYYTAGPESYQQGQLVYPFQNLAPGNYQLTLKAWDVHNNSNEASIHFIVAGSEKLVLANLFNFPNPMREYTTFQFDHNRAGEELEIRIEVYNTAGQQVKTMQTQVANSPEHIRSLTWDGISDKGNKLSKGIYIYKITVRSMADYSSAFQMNKLIIFQ